MSMFGADATQLSRPGAAGAAPLAPVQEQVTDLGLGGFLNMLNGVASNYAETQAKDKTKPWEAQLAEYQQKTNTLQQQYLTAGDSTTRNQILTQKRVLKTQYLANGAQFGLDFAKAINQVDQYSREGTGGDELEAERKADLEQERGILKRWTDSGGVYVSAGGMTEDQKAQALMISQRTTQIEKQQEQQWKTEDRAAKLRAEGREETRFNQQQDEYLRQRAAQENMSQVMNDGFSLFGANLDAAMKDVKSDGSNLAEVASKFSGSITFMKGQVSQLLQYDPQSRDVVLARIDELDKVAQRQLDPKTRTEEQKNILEGMLTAEKLRIARLPQGATWMVTNQIAPNIAVQSIKSTQMMGTIYGEADQAASTLRMPSVATGSTAVQKPILDAAERSILKATKGGEPNAQLFNDAKNTIYAAVNEMGNINSDYRGDMSVMVKAFGGEAAREVIKNGGYNEELAMKALPKFEQTYVNAIANKLQGFLLTPMGEATYTDGVRDINKTPTMVNSVSFTMQKDGTIKVNKALDPTMTYAASKQHIDKQIRDAQPFADDLATTVRAYAFLMNTNDYEKVWNDYKSLFLPGLYPTPDAEESARKKGWDGVGFIHNRSSWGSSGRTK